MLGLGDYESSDEEDANISPVQAETNGRDREIPSRTLSNSQQEGGIAPSAPSQDLPIPTAPSQPPEGGATIGPALGPSSPPAPVDTPADEAGLNPQSPYSSARSMIRNLTMPPVPNFDIPPSPPGSPPPGPTAKFARFLELKKQGVHFNEKLEKSTALRNPSLLQKLMDFAGISEQDQYASTLPPELAVPTSFPAWAYADQLAKTQQDITKKREAEKARIQREAIEFVQSVASSRGATSGSTDSKPISGSAAERVMADLDRGKSRSPLVQEGPNREGSRRSTRFDDSRQRYRTRSRSPRSRRSRSR